MGSQDGSDSGNKGKTKQANTGRDRGPAATIAFDEKTICEAESPDVLKKKWVDSMKRRLREDPAARERMGNAIAGMQQANSLNQLSDKQIAGFLMEDVWGNLDMFSWEGNLVDQAIKRLERTKAGVLPLDE